MLIRYGFDITVLCAQPTPMITLLSVREERRATDAQTPDSYHTIPTVPATTYTDLWQHLPTLRRACRRSSAVG